MLNLRGQGLRHCNNRSAHVPKRIDACDSQAGDVDLRLRFVALRLLLSTSGAIAPRGRQRAAFLIGSAATTVYSVPSADPASFLNPAPFIRSGGSAFRSRQTTGSGFVFPAA